jgi:uncharacterized tellurite resistance protein B-like protein
VCAFAWVDGVVHPSERAFVSRLKKRWKLDAAGGRQVRSWLAESPAPESVDPKLVPTEHRTRFIHAIESVIAADGEISAIEKKRLFSFAQLLR